MPESVAPLRRAAGELAQRCGATDQVVNDISLAVSEAATNAVIHAYREHPGQLALAAESENGDLWFRVIDEGAGLTPRADSPGIGLGLPLIARLTARFEVRPGPSGRGTELAMAFRVP